MSDTFFTLVLIIYQARRVLEENPLTTHFSLMGGKR